MAIIRTLTNPNGKGIYSLEFFGDFVWFSRRSEYSCGADCCGYEDVYDRIAEFEGTNREFWNAIGEILNDEI